MTTFGKLAKQENELQHSFVATALVAFTCARVLSAQPSATLAAEVTQSYTAVKSNLLKTAEKMPSEDYSFKPTPDVRSFAEVLNHVAALQMRTCAAVAGDDPKPSGPAAKITKTEVTAALTDSFAECDKAYGSLSDANAAEPVTTPRGQRTKLGLLADATGHDREQYGILTVYLRLKGIVPPSSERPAAH